jgi:hypothetical protein
VSFSLAPYGSLDYHLPAFCRYRELINHLVEGSENAQYEIHFFPKDLLLTPYHVGSVTRIVYTGLSRIFGTKMNNNKYRHSLATDMLRKGVDPKLAEKFLRTSSSMLKKVVWFKPKDDHACCISQGVPTATICIDGRQHK